MQKRCILIFPNFENMDVIDTIRGKYDPLCKLVNPHITLVFPFESELTASELKEHARRTLLDFSPFHLRMKGITASVEPEETYLFLHVTQGLQDIYELSGKLYTGILEKYQSDIYKDRYCPHITIGRIQKSENYSQILNNIGNQETEFISYIDRIYVEIINEINSSIIEITHEMMLQL